MERTQILQIIKEAGIVGAGGAGFPANIKLNCSADVAIANGTECEPLLRSDRLLMERRADEVVAGLKIAMEATGAERGVIAVKKHYENAVKALKKAVTGSNIELLLMNSFYPAGDERQIVYEATGRVVPTGGLPQDLGAVVQNVATLTQIAEAIEGKPVIERYVTVNGDVKRPAVYNVPIGMPVKRLIEYAGGPEDISDYSVIIGGPLMGRVTNDIEEPVTKTTGGVLVLRKDHTLIRKKTGDIEKELRLAKSVCCQCSLCTQMCPRNALGLKVEPHKIMRAMAFNPKSVGDINGIFSCCDCGICTYYACNFSLAPSRIMQRMKQELIKAGVRPRKETPNHVNGNYGDIKVPVSRLTVRLGIDKYDKCLTFIEEPLNIEKVVLPLKMHAGAPAKTIVKSGDKVAKGSKIAEAAEGVSAILHASIEGTVKVTDTSIEIEG